MQKRHFQHAADMVKAILDGHWTNELPNWAPEQVGEPIEVDTRDSGNVKPSYVRAVWTAEAFIKLFSEWNPLFDQTRFLIACGLVAAPVKAKKRRTA